MVTYYDVATSKKFIYGMVHKGEQKEKFELLEAFYNTQTGRGIKCVRDDKGGEYTSKEFLTYLESHGIRHEVTAPNAPSQNGIAERFNRTFEEAVTCMFEDAKQMCERAKLPPSF